MKQNLDNFGAFAKANALFHATVDDMEPLERRPLCMRLVGQQVASADSICANIEEGYGRGSRKEFVQFLSISRGSARETRGRFTRMNRWLAPDVVERRVALCDEIIAILTATINKLKSRPA